ncbi:hypothetical protein, partial [Vibrio coralliirubri]|uniref:hypothetical protein n=1 Tax=Vibrio coralliirubri TaxID=1516159 RepID=UPI000A62B5D6
IAAYSEDRIDGDSAYLTSFNPTKYNFPIYTFIHGLYFNYSPMPWDAIVRPKLLPSSIFSILTFSFLVIYLKNRDSICHDKKVMNMI